MQLVAHESTTGEEGAKVVAQLLVDGEHRTVSGRGNGPMSRSNPAASSSGGNGSGSPLAVISASGMTLRIAAMTSSTDAGTPGTL